MSGDKNTIRFHIIHSVKGGCGKTSFSLMKSIELAEKAAPPFNEKSKARVIYLDCDFRGSALKVLLYGLKKGAIPVGVERSGKSKYDTAFKLFCSRMIDFNIGYDECKTLTEYIRQEQQVDLDDIIAHGCCYVASADARKAAEEAGIIIDTGDKENIITGKIDFIFSPSESGMKRCFGHTALHSGRDATLNIGLFRLRMRKLLGKICNYGQLNEEYEPLYTDVVVDMPPGSDEYADALLSEIRELASNSKIKLIYYSLTTIDRGHLYATVDYIQNLVQATDRKQEICCVFSEMSENEFQNDYKKLNECFSAVAEEYKDFSEYLKNNLIYYANHFSRDYYDTTHSSEAVKLGKKISKLSYLNNHFEVM